MTLAKVKELDARMMLAKVKEQDGTMLAIVKVPSIPTSAACCDDLQKMWNHLPIPFITNNCFQTPSSKHSSTSNFTTVNYFIGLHLPQAAVVGILGTITIASIIPSCSFTFASIISSFSFPFSSLVQLLLQLSPLYSN